MNVPGGDSVHLCSIYLHHMQGLSDINLSILSHAATARDVWGGSFVLGGDFNLTPQLLGDTTLDSCTRGRLIFPSDVDGTCSTTGGVKMLDYFLVSEGLAQGLRKVSATHHSPHPCPDSVLS